MLPKILLFKLRRNKMTNADKLSQIHENSQNSIKVLKTLKKNFFM